MLVVAGAAGVALLDGGDATEPSTASTAPTATSPLRAAVERADVHLAAVTDADVEALIVELCSSIDGARVAAMVVALGVSRPADVEALVEGVGRGAEQHCPAVPAEHPELVNDAYATALTLLG